jgi:riboflavin kinase/FMN adenylyltransferase
MEVVRGWHNVPSALQSASVAIGNFDGVHKGHQAVLDAAKKAARISNRPSGVVVFEPHPRKYFQPGKPLFTLTTLECKLELFSAYGMDMVVVLPFDTSIASFSADDFARNVLMEGLRARHVTTGYNFFFGKGRDGNPSVLRALGNKYDFGVTIVEAVGESGEIFSSTRIRELLAESDVAGAADMLGHCWCVEGVVESGAERGTTMGFPTANIRLPQGAALSHGIYAVRVRVDGKAYNAVAYLGTRPTFDAGAPLLESFIFDFSGDLYGKKIRVEFVDFVRADAKFKSADDLIKQIKVDCEKAKEILAPFDHKTKAQ